MKSNTNNPVLLLPINLIELILNELDLSDFGRLRCTCRFFNDYDYSRQQQRIAATWFAQYLANPQQKSSEKRLYQAANLAHIESLLQVWEEHTDHAIKVANSRHKAPYFDGHTRCVEAWAKNEQLFIYYAVIVFNKALKVGDHNDALFAAYMTTLLYNKSEKIKQQARAYLYRKGQTPQAFILHLLTQAESSKITRPRVKIQERALKQVNATLHA